MSRKLIKPSEKKKSYRCNSVKYFWSNSNTLWWSSFNLFPVNPESNQRENWYKNDAQSRQSPHFSQCTLKLIWSWMQQCFCSHFFCIPYARHYNPQFVYFLPTFWSSFMYSDLWPYVWLVFKSGFKSRAGYSGACTVHRIFLI